MFAIQSDKGTDEPIANFKTNRCHESKSHTTSVFTQVFVGFFTYKNDYHCSDVEAKNKIFSIRCEYDWNGKCYWLYRVSTLLIKFIGLL